MEVIFKQSVAMYVDICHLLIPVWTYKRCTVQTYDLPVELEPFFFFLQFCMFYL